MTATMHWLYRQLPGLLAIVLVMGMYQLGRLPDASADDERALAAGFGFTAESIQLPGGYPQQEIRQVNQDYEHIDAWISAVGAGISMNDLDGDGLPNDMCITDPRTDTVIVTPTPDERGARYAPFALEPGGLPMNEAMAPMGCAPGDFNEDGRMDLLVYFWGRTPILHLADPQATGLSADAYLATELVPGSSTVTYGGPQWNTNAVALDDFDGDGHVDIYIGNYFPHGPVLDPTISGGVAMNDSLSNASNGGADYFFRWTGTTGGERPEVTFEKLDDVIPQDLSQGWVLGSSANDADGDQLPELYLAQDHGHDAMLHNRSVPGEIRFEPVLGERVASVPKSKRMGADSFKGMAVDWADLDRDGLYDLFVSNITTSYGLQESNFQFMATAGSLSEMRAGLQDGVAPWSDESTASRTAWSGWGWDVKTGDFANSGELSIAQTTGFVKGEVNRWPQLQELATGNDLAVQDPAWWPNLREGDDIGGSQRLRFFVRTPEGAYLDLAGELGLDAPVPTRGIATADVDGDGLLDMAIARQWDQPVFHRNTASAPGAFLGLRLTHADDTPVPGALPAPGSPVVGAQVEVTTPDGRTLIGHVDGGGGHSGKRSTDVHIGLGDVTGPMDVHLRWRDRDGQVQEQDLQLDPGWHSVQLGSQADER